MGLLAVLVKLAPRANPVLALHQNARELVAQFLDHEFQERQPVQHIGFDGLLELRACKRFLQNLREQLAERTMLGRSRLFAVLAVDQRHVDGLPNQVQQVFPRKFDEPGAEKNVIMDVVRAQGEVRKPDFGGVRLELHPGRMGEIRRNSRFGHSELVD